MNMTDAIQSLQESLSILETARRRAYRTQHQLAAPSDDTQPVSRKELLELLAKTK